MANEHNFILVNFSYFTFCGVQQKILNLVPLCWETICIVLYKAPKLKNKYKTFRAKLTILVYLLSMCTDYNKYKKIKLLNVRNMFLNLFRVTCTVDC